MNWEYDGEGQWAANSALTDDGDSFEWLVGVCEDGTFSVSDSSSELTDREETFDTLRDAKSWCEENESAMVAAYKREMTIRIESPKGPKWEYGMAESNGNPVPSCSKCGRAVRRNHKEHEESCW